jgi:hypothetical protein
MHGRIVWGQGVNISKTVGLMRLFGRRLGQREGVKKMKWPDKQELGWVLGPTWGFGTLDGGDVGQL